MDNGELIDGMAEFMLDNGYSLMPTYMHEELLDKEKELAKLKQEPQKESDYVKMIYQVDYMVKQCFGYDTPKQLKELIESHKSYLSTQYKGSE